MLISTENNRSFYAALVTSFLLWVEWGIATSFLSIQIYELGGSPVEVGLVFTVFAALMVPSTLLWGSLSDSIGKKKLFIVLGMLGLPPIYVLMATQRVVLTLILLRGSTAVFKGAIEPCIWALVSDLSPSQAVGRNMGLLSFAGMAGFAVGPVLGGLIAEGPGFSSLWFFIASICLAGGLVFLIAGSDSAKLVQRDRMSPFAAFRMRKIVLKVLVLSIAFAVFLLGFSFLGPNLNVYLVRDLGYSKTFIGILSFLGAGAASLTQPFFGYVSDKYGRKPVMILGGFSLALGNLVLLLGGEAYWVVLSYILINCYNSFRMAASAYINDVVTPGEKSRAMSILNSIGSLARSSAAAAGGLVIAATDIQTALKIAATFPTAAILIILFALKEPKRSYGADYPRGSS